jgi:hypothetical protein
MSAPVLTREILSCADADPALRRALYAVFERCYDCVSWERFEADFAGKDWVILLRDETGAVRGFSTQQVFSWEWRGQPMRVLFSGDTVIDPEFWGSPELIKGWCSLAARVLRAEPKMPLYWFLISKGYRTYLYLPLFFHSFVPSAEGEDPEVRARLTDLARWKFGEEFDPARGLIRFRQSLGQLTPQLAEIPAGKRSEAHANFFLQRNPDFAKGVELACLAEVSLQNMRGLAHRWVARALAEDSDV